MVLICACVCVCVCVCARAQSCPIFRDPWTVALQAPLSIEFSRQEYWSGLPFPTLGHLPNPGIKPVSLASPTLAGRFFTTVPSGKVVKGHCHKMLGVTRNSWSESMKYSTVVKCFAPLLPQTR